MKIILYFFSWLVSEKWNVSLLLDKLRLKELEVTKALEAKQVLISDILQIPVQDFDKIIDNALEKQTADDTKGILLAALDQGNKKWKMIFQKLFELFIKEFM